jgi:hypothetical protein
MARVSKEEFAATMHVVARRKASTQTDGGSSVAVVRAYSGSNGDDTGVMVDLVKEQVKAIAAGDLGQLESLLLGQAIAMQAMFADLSVRARSERQLANIQALTGLALKCASGSRQAIVALGELKMPRTAIFAQRANVNNGQLQINNGVPMQALASPAKENAGQIDELLENQHGNFLVAGAQSTSGRDDPHLATVGVIDRPDIY